MFDPPPRKPPSYELRDGPCYRCSKPLISTRYDHPYYYLVYDCPINQFAPHVGACEHYTREPGVD